MGLRLGACTHHDEDEITVDDGDFGWSSFGLGVNIYTNPYISAGVLHIGRGTG